MLELFEGEGISSFNEGLLDIFSLKGALALNFNITGED